MQNREPFRVECGTTKFANWSVQFARDSLAGNHLIWAFRFWIYLPDSSINSTQTSDKLCTFWSLKLWVYTVDSTAWYWSSKATKFQPDVTNAKKLTSNDATSDSCDPRRIGRSSRSSSRRVPLKERRMALKQSDFIGVCIGLASKLSIRKFGKQTDVLRCRYQSSAATIDCH